MKAALSIARLFLPVLFGSSALSAQVVINEFLASNTKGIRDQAQQCEDWIELRNTSTRPVNVSGWFLSDKLARPTKWPIPANTTIPAGGRLLIWCDEDQQDGPYHANFKLNATSGEELWLRQSDGKTIVDRVKFGPQLADVSCGRVFDGRGGSDYFVTFPQPTPRKDNFDGSCVSRRYSSFESRRHPLALDWIGTTQIGQTINVTVQGGVPNSAFLVWIAADSAPFEIPINPRFGLLINLPLFTLVIPSNSSGQGLLPLALPRDTRLDRARLYLQAGGVDTAGLFSSNCVEAVLCR